MKNLLCLLFVSFALPVFAQNASVCDQTSVRFEPTGEDCCYRLTVDTDFTDAPGLSPSLLITPVDGAAEDYAAVNLLPRPDGWTVTISPEGGVLAVGSAGPPPSGNGVVLATVCLEEAPTTAPARFLAEWQSETELLCTDTVAAVCSGCLEITDDAVGCGAAEFVYTFSFVNHSPFAVNTVRLLLPEDDGADLLLSAETIALAQEVPPGAAYGGQVTVAFLDVDDDGEFCFDVVLRQVIPSRNLNINCCYTTHCVTTEGIYPLAVIADSLVVSCGEEIQLDGRLSSPSGLAFTWSARGDGMILSGADESMPFVVGEGVYRLIVTDPENGCRDTTEAEVLVTELLANDDLLDRFDGEGSGTVNLLDNDVWSGSVSIRLLNDPEFGEAEVDEDGRFTLRIDPCLTGETTVNYEIRSTACGDLLATATIFIRSSLAGNAENRYNAFSPNGDGMNDLFVFDQIERCPTRFPERAITIFNRWGDILFEASPYNNDWDGTNKRGGEIPEGTYYYVLRLDIGEGAILRGDVTVIR